MIKLNGLFDKKIAVVNIGIPSFAEDLKKQSVPVQHVDWRPPAGGNARMRSLIDKIKKGAKS